MKRHTNIIITAVAALLIVTLAGREFIKNHKKEPNDKSSTNVSENTCEDIPDTSIPYTSISDTSISDTSVADTSVADTNTPDTSTSEADILDTTYENNKEQFYISEIPDDIFEKMQGKSYKADCTLPRENLRYIHVLHVGFDNQVHEGELVVNKDIADDVLEIFKELYESGYQIEKVRLVDEYDADDEASMSDNNHRPSISDLSLTLQRYRSMEWEWRWISTLYTILMSKQSMGSFQLSLQMPQIMLTVAGIFRTRLIMTIYAISCLRSMALSGEAIGRIPRIISILKNSADNFYGSR